MRLHWLVSRSATAFSRILEWMNDCGELPHILNRVITNFIFELYFIHLLLQDSSLRSSSSPPNSTGSTADSDGWTPGPPTSCPQRPPKVPQDRSRKRPQPGASLSSHTKKDVRWVDVTVSLICFFFDTPVDPFILFCSTRSPPCTQTTAGKLTSWRRRKGERRGSMRLGRRVGFSRPTHQSHSCSTLSPSVGEQSKKSLKMISAFPSTPSVYLAQPPARRSLRRSVDTGTVKTLKKG